MSTRRIFYLSKHCLQYDSPKSQSKQKPTWLSSDSWKSDSPEPSWTVHRAQWRQKEERSDPRTTTGIGFRPTFNMLALQLHRHLQPQDLYTVYTGYRARTWVNYYHSYATLCMLPQSGVLLPKAEDPQLTLFSTTKVTKKTLIIQKQP